MCALLPAASARISVSDSSLRFAPTYARGETPFRMTAWFWRAPRGATRVCPRAETLFRHEGKTQLQLTSIETRCFASSTLALAACAPPPGAI